MIKIKILYPRILEERKLGYEEDLEETPYLLKPVAFSIHLIRSIPKLFYKQFS